MTLLLPALWCAPAAAGDIAPVRENGRVIFRNDLPDPKPTRASKSERRTRQYVYWSVTEKRWKRVPPPTQRAVQAARSAAAEVSEFVSTKPEAGAAAGTLNPNYRSLVRGRSVSSAEVDEMIEAAAARHGVDPNLVRAIVKVESNFNPRAVSRKGAMGLMQLMPATARSLQVSNPFDPAQNVEGGVKHLKGLLRSYNGDVSLSLAAYNAGAGAVARSGGVPPYRETRNYVRQITRLYGGDGVVAWTGSAPIRASRQENGVLRFSNTD